jgi:serine/threonine-protein kinase
MDAPSPKSSGRYAVFRELASGGMASVFYARLMGPSGFTRTVAVKRPHPQLATDEDFAKMFIDEARVASRIHHPNVVATLDVIETPNELGLVMDYVHGEPLSRLWAATRKRNEHVPVPIAAAILLDVLHGLHAAHEALDEDGRPLGIVHRDISPQNVLVGADGVTRIVDFGIAKAAGRLHTTRDGAIKGKYAYMAPEQLRAEQVTRRTDVYAASIVLWELLTGQGLFRGANEGEEIYKSLEAVVPLPSAVAPHVPAVFDEIVMRGLDRNPERRFPTARAMAIEIERAAPAVRPSEVAAWVEDLAGEVLSARAAVIAEMEGSGREITVQENPFGDAPTLIYDPANRVAEVESQVSQAGVVAEPTSGSAARTSRRLVGLTLGVLLIASLFGARTRIRGSSPQAADVTPPLLSSAPSAAATPPPMPTPVVAAGADGMDASAAATPPPGKKSARPSTRGHHPNSPACDPPYIVDSAGREIFKLQCL